MARTVTTPQRGHRQQDRDSKEVMTNGIPQARERDVISQKQEFITEIKKSQQKKQPWEPAIASMAIRSQRISHLMQYGSEPTRPLTAMAPRQYLTNSPRSPQEPRPRRTKTAWIRRTQSRQPMAKGLFHWCRWFGSRWLKPHGQPAL